MKIYVARHGETEWNRDGKIQTHSNCPATYLTEDGKKQAEKVGNTLRDEGIEVVYHSDMRRSIQTAQIIAKSIKCKNFVMDERLSDASLGHWDGMTIKEVEQKYPDDYKRWRADKFSVDIAVPPQIHVPKFEDYNTVLKRANPFADEVVRNGKNALLVGHRAVNRLIIYHLLDGSTSALDKKYVSTIHFGNTMIYKIAIDGASRQAEYNECDGKGWSQGLSRGELFKPSSTSV